MKFFAEIASPTTEVEWLNKTETERKKQILSELKKNKIYENFEVIKAPNNGQVVIKIEKNIPVDIRGLLLLNLEQKLKLSIDKGITIWCDPVGDKSKLRNLRGVKIKA
jgi:Tfp pilus assembly protein PilZ